MDHYSLEGSNIRVHSRTMSRGCARITKPPYTAPRGTCLFVNLLIRLRVTDNKCMSSSGQCEYSKVDTSTTHIFLASSVPCIALSHLESWRILHRCIQTLGMIRSIIISLLIYFLKTTTIPTYKTFPYHFRDTLTCNIHLLIT